MAGLYSGYRDAAQLGVDRFLALLGARCRWPDQDCLIIDAGTALTIDLLRSDGQHQGGCILPGLALMRSALAAGTERLGADIDATLGRELRESGALADHTGLAIELGIGHAALGAIERLRCAYPGAQMLLCGGDAPLFAEALALPDSLHPTLVLEGLACYANCTGTGTDHPPR